MGRRRMRQGTPVFGPRVRQMGVRVSDPFTHPLRMIAINVPISSHRVLSPARPRTSTTTLTLTRQMSRRATL
eukprot:5034695-Karenia_brevis.AAC.1